MERVSIIVPVLSATTKQDLTACVASVMAQSYPELELLLVGEASSTTALKLKYPQITIIPTVEKLNASACRNLGELHATGSYLTFVNASETLVPQFVATLVQAMEQNASDMVISVGNLLQLPGGSKLYSLSAQTAEKSQARPQSEPQYGAQELSCQSMTTRECIELHHLFDIPYEPSGKLFKRVSYENAGIHFDENQNLWEANAWHLQCMFGLQSLTLVHYQGVHHDSCVRPLTKENLCAYFDTLSQCYDILKQHGYAALYDNFFLKFVAHSWVQRALLASSRQDQIAVFKYGWQLMQHWGYSFDLNLEAAEQQQRKYQMLGENSHDLGLNQEAEHCATLCYIYELIAYFLQHLNLRKIPY